MLSPALFSRVLSFLFVLCLNTLQTAQAQQMFTAGNVDVSPSGAAVYSVPLDLPPGAGGLQPTVGLTYNSQGENTYLGWRWSLAGVSGITRCPRTLAQDGVRGTVNNNANDRFCLDGQRLVVVAGSYGAPGSEYRTEIDTFVKVVANGSQGGAPLSFTVWTKSGQIIDYGATTDSRLEASNSAVPIIWMQSRIRDRQSNYIDWQYYKNAPLGEIYPIKVLYTGHLNTGRAPFNVVAFSYEQRPEIARRYMLGSLIQQGLRMNAVQTYQNGALVRNYKIAYMATEAASRDSKITSIQSCAASAADCLPPLQFTWSEQNTRAERMTAVSHTPGGGHGAADGGWQLAEVFGDGRAEYHTHSSDGQHFVSKFRDDGSAADSWNWTGGAGFTPYTKGKARMINLFGDGKSTYYDNDHNRIHWINQLVPGEAQARSCTWNNYDTKQDPLGRDEFGNPYYETTGDNGNIITSPYYNVSKWPGTDNENWEVADLFGDGWPVVYTRPFRGFVHYGVRFRPDCSVQTFIWTQNVHDAGNDGWQLVDLFGDGRPVYYTRTANNHYATRFNADGSAQSWQWTGSFAFEGYAWQLVDLFGDGRKAFYTTDRRGKHYATRLNEDGSKQEWQWASTPGGLDGNWRMADMLGNGRMQYYNRYGTTHYIAQLNPDGTLDNYVIDGHGEADSSWDLVDLFGEGRQLYYTHGLDGHHFASRFNPDGTVENFDWMGHGVGARGWKMADLFGEGRLVYHTFNDPFNHYITRLGPKVQRTITQVSVPGTGTSTSIGYKSIAQGAYTKVDSGAGEIVGVQFPLYVVWNLNSSDGLGGQRVTTYWYDNLKVERSSGRGLLGFATQYTTDNNTGIVTRTDYRQDFPLIGALAGQTVKLSNGQILSSTNVEYDFRSFTNNSRDAQRSLGPGKRYQTVSPFKADKSWDLNGTFLNGTQTYMPGIDDYGNVTDLQVQNVDANGVYQGYKKITSSVYTNNPSTWILGRLTRSTVNASVPGTLLPAAVGTAPKAKQVSGP
ncbi:MAG: SpvB/TcaC N-terminal domain-containing protein [Burkholderiaceae bacterium]